MAGADSVESRAPSGAAGVSPGQRARNLFSGETMTFREPGDKSSGERIELDLEVRPLGAPGGLPHRHRPVERFKITDGSLLALVAGQWPRIARSGDLVEVPTGRWHFLFALRRSRARVFIEPAMHFDELLVKWAEVGSGHLRAETLRRLPQLLREHDCI
jgi:hypothetical protein